MCRVPSTERMPCGCPSQKYTVRIAGGYAVRRCTYMPDCTMGAHAHFETRIVLTVRGQLESVYGSLRFPLAAERAIVRPAHVEHRDVYAGETVCLGILLPAAERRPTTAFTFFDDELPGVARRLYHELDATDSASDLALENLCAHIEAHIASGHDKERPAPKWVRHVREQIEDEYGNPPTLKALAMAVDRNVTHVATVFRATYGKSIGDYLRDVRVWKTRKLVEDASIPLAEVAQRGGFADQSHFARIFRRRFAMTPGEYRRRTARVMAIMPAAVSTAKEGTT